MEMTHERPRILTCPISAPSHSFHTIARRARAALIALLDACGAFEWVAVSYLGLSGLLMILFAKNLPRAARLLGIHGGFAAAVLALTFFGGKSPAAENRTVGARVLQAIRTWYPQAVFLFCFEELGALMHLVHRGWCDAWLLAFDHWLTGVYPAVWFARVATPALTDFMQFAYLTYFFFLIILALILYFRGPDSHLSRDENHSAFWSVMTGSMAAYATGYTISIFFPIESPYFSLAALHLAPLHGGPFTFLSDLIERLGRVHGGAFPSEHVAGSFVALLGAWRYRRKLFWLYLPLVACMCVSTVYVRNHYIADVLAGLVTGTIGFWLGERLMRLPGANPEAKNAPLKNSAAGE
jgi:membrane-associated phospholipid phosphatase